MKVPRVLTIAGSDSSGGAGIQADLKTATCHGCYVVTAVTAVTAQNSRDVSTIQAIATSVVREQIRTAVDDIGVDAIKIGMVPSSEIVEVVAEELQRTPHIPVVLDPVMTSTSGTQLSSGSTIVKAFETLFPLSLIVTPNLVETEALINTALHSDTDIEAAGKRLLRSGAQFVLIKGAHRGNGTANDCLLSAADILWFRESFIDTKNTHGTGCTLSTSIACFLAKEHAVPVAVGKAKAFVTRCLTTFTGISLGHGHGAVCPVLPGAIEGDHS